jgi:hypothetical protein
MEFGKCGTGYRRLDLEKLERNIIASWVGLYPFYALWCYSFRWVYCHLWILLFFLNDAFVLNWMREISLLGGVLIIRSSSIVVANTALGLAPAREKKNFEFFVFEREGLWV